ncbi:phosphohydrolase, partial [Ammoniphilus sp. 3BR4]
VYEAALHFGYNPQEEVVIALQHMALSHHGKLEYASPVLPQLPEAVALSQIDLMDTKLQAVEDGLNHSKEDCVTGIRAIDGGTVYRLKVE